MIEELVPDAVAVAASCEDVVDAQLYPEEEAVVTGAVEKRRREFETGRACARAALAQLGLPAQPIPVGLRGAPRWPVGVVGSITHCDGYRACAVARASDLVTIGIDAEPNRPLPDGLLADIALPSERQALQTLLRERPGICWDRLLFCMKETVYKAWFPLTERWLGFEEATIEIDPTGGSFSARLLVGGPVLDSAELRGFGGRWTARNGLLLAAVVQPVGAR